MGAVTKTLGFGITGCTTFENPYLFAKRISTLDHLTNGRIAWVSRDTMNRPYNNKFGKNTEDVKIT